MEETQLSLTNHMMHLCKRNGVADLKTRPSLYMLPCRIWSFCISINTGEPQHWERWDPVLLLWGVVDHLKTTPLSIYITTSNLVVLRKKVYAYTERNPQNWVAVR